jgi:hypothetical protein
LPIPASAIATPPPPADVQVQVAADPHGGWQVTATTGNRVVSSRHYDDWHRVERARLTLAVLAAVPAPAPAV